jgi:hypothetical protein
VNVRNRAPEVVVAVEVEVSGRNIYNLNDLFFLIKIAIHVDSPDINLVIAPMAAVEADVLVVEVETECFCHFPSISFVNLGTCYNCGEFGHFSGKCPNFKSGGVGGGSRCKIFQIF